MNHITSQHSNKPKPEFNNYNRQTNYLPPTKSKSHNLKSSLQYTLIPIIDHSRSLTYYKRRTFTKELEELKEELEELSLTKNTYFGAIHYEIHLDMKVDKTKNKIFQERSLSIYVNSKEDKYLNQSLKQYLKNPRRLHIIRQLLQFH